MHGFSNLVDLKKKNAVLMILVCVGFIRLHPPVWANTRHAFEDDVLPSGVFVPAG